MILELRRLFTFSWPKLGDTFNRAVSAFLCILLVPSVFPGLQKGTDNRIVPVLLFNEIEYLFGERRSDALAPKVGGYFYVVQIDMIAF